MNDSTCLWPECERPALKRGFCDTHYARAKRYGDFTAPWTLWAAKHPEKPSMPDAPECRWPDCVKPAFARGLCHRDYQRARLLGDFESPWVIYGPERTAQAETFCRWPECSERAAYAGLCSRDYSRAKKVGNQVDPWTEWVTSGTCTVCGKSWDDGRNINLRFCSNSCRMSQWASDNPERARALKMDSVRRRRARMAGVTVENFTIKDVRMAHGDDCYLCGKRINYALKFPHPKSPSLDHVTPISAGGAHSVANTAMAHMECNNRKNAGATNKVPAETLFAL